MFLYFLTVRLQTSIVCFLSLFSEGLMCMCKNFKLLCCAAYNPLSQIVCLVCQICGVQPYFQPNFVVSAKIRLIRISAEKIVQRAEFFWKIRLRGLYRGMHNVDKIVAFSSNSTCCGLLWICRNKSTTFHNKSNKWSLSLSRQFRLSYRGDNACGLISYTLVHFILQPNAGLLVR